MLFNSFSFLSFFLLFFAVYWTANANWKIQNKILLVGSYIFYSFLNWKFAVFLFLISTIYFFLGLFMVRIIRRQKVMLITGLLVGVGSLAFFKYYNFFVSSVNDLFSGFGLSTNLKTLSILIPVGISYYIFRVISYLIDIRHEKIKPEKDYVSFLNYVSFFPTLLSGPIDKAGSFISQLKQKREFSHEGGSQGMKQILWGLFKKMAVADSIAPYTDYIFDQHAHLPASVLVLGAFFYAIQIYADFSGYSDMAIGVAALLGFKVPKNFNFPFFAQNIADFWRRWHMSLTNWLTEYVFTPLTIKFRDIGTTGLILAVVINFTICGIWHGANWTFVLFGFLHGCYFIPLVLQGSIYKKKKWGKSKLPDGRQLLAMVSTFTLVMFTFIVFRANDLTHAVSYFSSMFSLSLFSIPTVHPWDVFVLILLMLVLEWIGKTDEFALEKFASARPRMFRYLVYYSLIFAILWFGGDSENFIYFQF